SRERPDRCQHPTTRTAARNSSCIHRGVHRWRIVATGTTGGRVLEAAPDLDVTRLKSGPLGGDQQIGALIATGEVDALIFFVDPLTPMPHDVDVKALMRLAIVYDIPMALNEATADKLIATLHA
ncbi:methylglyoxal synthase, partial [Rhizobium sp. BK060]|uniref:methylglyoxal synthase n=1 Tax=Rhizobium sp. BK060 TaxID=2587096 RepID=UPI001FEFAC61